MPRKGKARRDPVASNSSTPPGPRTSSNRHFSAEDSIHEIRKRRVPSAVHSPANERNQELTADNGSDSGHQHSTGESQSDGNGEDEDDDDDDNDEDDNLTLKDRQSAINKTHPFGVRVWKWALYQKPRSVHKGAHRDIHDGPHRPVNYISRTLRIFNLIWTILFGWWMALVSLFCAAVCYSLALFSEGPDYGKTFVGLAFYIVHPFEKYVQLEQDELYAAEDGHYDQSGRQYAEWWQRDVERGRLFFVPSTNRSHQGIHGVASTDETEALLGRDGEDDNSGNGNGSGNSNGSHRTKRRLFGRGHWSLGRVVFFALFYAIITPVLLTVSGICWLLVFTIPMGKVTYILFDHLRRHPLALTFHYSNDETFDQDRPDSVLVCTYRSVGKKYWKYTVDGTNIILINLLALVVFAIFDQFVLVRILELDIFLTNSLFIFGISILSTIPLAYFIGQAVASISAQSSMGVGATVNAFFSTVVEVYLYCCALKEGKAQLVEGSIIGSVFAGILLLPGISMCFGALKRKTQRFNARSAGVTSTMLLFAIIGAFGPTLFYQMYGTHQLNCHPCSSQESEDDCRRCYFSQEPQVTDKFYRQAIRPYVWFSALMLFLAYVTGLLFTLRTHAAQIWNAENDDRKALAHRVESQLLLNAPSSAQRNDCGLATSGQRAASSGLSKAGTRNASMLHLDQQAHDASAANNSGGHDAPNWSRLKSSAILLSATLAYAIIAEILVDNVDAVLKNVDIGEKFLGITLFALVPNATEFLNAISFAMNGNIALSMEIGSAYALQVCLLQIPALVLFSVVNDGNLNPLSYLDYAFTLIFPQWDMVTVILSVFLLSYVYGEGKSNYFKGTILVFAYLVIMMGYFLSEMSDPNVLGVNPKDRLAINGRLQSFTTFTSANSRVGGDLYY